MQLAQNTDIERIDYDEERILINPLDVVELGARLHRARSPTM
jgi:hypothetical protein